MSLAYRAVGWSPQKRKYDLVMAACMAVYLAVFAAVTLATQPSVTIETLLLRATGSLAFLMLAFILLIGPLARLSPRFLPLLHNRRHLGVATFLIALAHGALATFQFHALGDLNPLVSLLVSDGSFGDPLALPFQPLGAAALVILFVMAATSHDFWLANLTPRIWKSLHMAVHAAFALLVGHVALGALQGEGKLWLWLPLAALAGLVVLLHLLAGAREWRRDRTPATPGKSAEESTDDEPDAAKDRGAKSSLGDAGPPGYLRALPLTDLADGEGRVVSLGDERAAVFLNGDEVSCVSNVCRHQMGPIGEGRIIDGCITCPWHGFQYDPTTGCAPPPFDDKLETYDVAIQGGFVWVNPKANELGSSSRTARLPDRPAPASTP